MPDPSLVLEEVSAGYHGTQVLKRLSLEVPAGALVAIIGPNGHGKTTLLSVLLRFADTDEGRIAVDGVDLRELPVEQWRSRIAWLPQRPYLFDASVADNVRLGVDPTPVGFTVTNTDNDGPGSLRQALADANLNPGPDTVLFAIGPAGTPAASRRWPSSSPSS